MKDRRPLLPDFSNRARIEEWMESSDVAAGRLCKTLDDLARLNDRIFGHTPSIDGIEQLMGDRRSLSVLDVGTGCGDVPRLLVDRARRRGIDIDVTAIELSQVAVEHARNRSSDYGEITVERRDLFEMTGRRRFDVVHAALMLHHLDGERAIEGLQKMWDLSRLGVVINDLHRHPVSYFGSFALLRLLSDNAMIHHDGAVSILRGFTREELLQMGHDTGAREVDVRWRPLFRWQMVLAA